MQRDADNQGGSFAHMRGKIGDAVPDLRAKQIDGAT
jgi:hypothetical protein